MSARGHSHAVLLTDSRRNSGGDDPRRHVLRDHGARADDAVLSDGHAGANDHAAAEPDVVGERDRFCVSPPVAARPWVEWVCSCQELHPGGDLTRGSDRDRRNWRGEYSADMRLSRTRLTLLVVGSVA